MGTDRKTNRHENGTGRQMKGERDSDKNGQEEDKKKKKRRNE